MICITAQDLLAAEKHFRTKLVNGVSGFKSANLIGTRSPKGIDNVAIFSSVVHIGADPPLIGFIMRPVGVPRHTYQNIIATGHFTINAVTEALHIRAHATSARYGDGESEFEACGIEPLFRESCPAPFVDSSPLQLHCTLEDDIAIPSNGTRLVIGRLQALYLAQGLLSDDGFLHLAEAGVLAISALEGYHGVGSPRRYDYAKPHAPVKTLQP
jgi:flavin reductase (DIM6/NTAB) family NADH-FMN oxidoreductase RutF